MFRVELETRLKRIFGLPKVTFSMPGESYEQDTLFVEVKSSPARVTKGNVYAKVTGSIYIFSQNQNFPFGFFAKRIQNAELEDTKDFFFFDMDQNALNSPARLQNISEIRGRFMFLYSAQYDPNQGVITSVGWTEDYILNPLATGDGQLLDLGEGDKLGVSK